MAALVSTVALPIHMRTFCNNAATRLWGESQDLLIHFKITYARLLVGKPCTDALSIYSVPILPSTCQNRLLNFSPLIAWLYLTTCSLNCNYSIPLLSYDSSNSNSAFWSFLASGRTLCNGAPAYCAWNHDG